MSTPDFLVVFSGATLDGFDSVTVQTQVEAALRLTEDQSGKLFSGKPVVIKRTQDMTEALTLAQKLKKLGADVSVRVAPKPDAAPKDAVTSKPPNEALEASRPTPLNTVPAETQYDNPGLTLAENIGFIVPPAPPAAPVNLDLSRLSAVTEFDEPLEAPKDYSIPELDLSSLSVKDNDGSPLVEPAPDVAPSVLVPDFGLDAPGAMLETVGLPDPVAMPDLSRLTVKASEGDLLESNERQQIAAVVVDTSRLSITDNA